MLFELEVSAAAGETAFDLKRLLLLLVELINKTASSIKVPHRYSDSDHLHYSFHDP